MHCKAFRRLKHKTQVFVAPEGDHYRTRLTHTLEVTGISRTVARALRLNEDLTEAIGLGHDVGHPPFGHIGEDVLDRAGRERFGRGFRHNEHSLRVVDVLEGLNLTEPGPRRHPAPLARGAGEPATLEGKIVRLVDRIAYINHDIDDAVRAGVLRAGRPAGRGDRDPRPDGLRAHRHARPRPGRALRAAGDIVQGESVGRAMYALRSFMFERVYLGPRARAEHAKIERVLRGLFEWYCEHPEELPSRRRVRGRPRDRLSGRHDRPFRDPRLDRALRSPGPRALMARYTDESRERVRDAVNFEELVGARTELKRAGVGRLQGLCPFHEERTPSFGINPVEKVYYCFGCGAGGDVFRFVMDTEGLDFSEALESLAERYRVTLERETEDPRDAAQARAARAAATRCWSARRPTTCACCGSRRRRRSRASTWSRAGWRRTRCAPTASASRRMRGTACCIGSQRDGYTDGGAARGGADPAQRGAARG